MGGISWQYNQYELKTSWFFLQFNHWNGCNSHHKPRQVGAQLNQEHILQLIQARFLKVELIKKIGAVAMLAP